MGDRDSEGDNLMKLRINHRQQKNQIPIVNNIFAFETGKITEYQQIEETMSPKALKCIGDWILSIAKQRSEYE